ncbi:MAG: peptidyl-prolyl cis-trans isomerase [Cellvibrionales bacterium TMED148]|nr:cyclophilin [Porticoccaceae bacterium]RPG88576.1 MAG: peptidyl-prolyl cis-trans isomerase [Cellvibrionales bacterium TMED148]
MITLSTTMGDISVTLDFENAPISSQNFLRYCRDDFYIGTIFHRVIDGFMIQGGGLEADMSEKETRDSIINEADNGRNNLIGTLAMARTSDPDSASSQFFINVADNNFLDHSDKTSNGWGYAVFGDVTDGMHVVRNIKTVATGTLGYDRDVPNDPIEITGIFISDAYEDV